MVAAVLWRGLRFARRQAGLRVDYTIHLEQFVVRRSDRALGGKDDDQQRGGGYLKAWRVEWRRG